MLQHSHRRGKHRNTKNLNMVPYQQTFLKHQKVKFYYIHTKRKKIQYQQCLNTSRCKQNKHVKFTKFLGIFIDEHLSWTTHIDNLSKQVARNVEMLNKLKHFLPMYIMRTIYCSAILSHLQYCTLLWENSYCTNLNKLRILQKKAIRIITNSHYIAHTDPLFSKLKLLKLDDLYKHQLVIFMYKAANSKLPDSMSSMLTRTQNIHKHNLRHQNSYYIQNIRANSRKCTINYSGPVYWNALPSKLKQLVSIQQFKNKLKELLLSKYQ